MATPKRSDKAPNRPLLFATPELLQKAVDEYFSEDGGAYYQGRYMPTMSGLARHLKVCTRTLRYYGSRDKYSDVVDNARQYIEEHLERQLYGNAPTGCIFNLKNNFGWKDANQVEHSTKVIDDGEDEF